MLNNYILGVIGLVTFLITFMVFMPILNGLIPEMSGIGTAAIGLVMVIPVVLIVSAIYLLFMNQNTGNDAQR